jgi:hypothetical protein
MRKFFRNNKIFIKNKCVYTKINNINKEIK